MSALRNYEWWNPFNCGRSTKYFVLFLAAKKQLLKCKCKCVCVSVRKVEFHWKRRAEAGSERKRQARAGEAGKVEESY